MVDISIVVLLTVSCEMYRSSHEKTNTTTHRYSMETKLQMLIKMAHTYMYIWTFLSEVRYSNNKRHSGMPAGWPCLNDKTNVVIVNMVKYMLSSLYLSVLTICSDFHQGTAVMKVDIYNITPLCTPYQSNSEYQHLTVVIH